MSRALTTEKVFSPRIYFLAKRLVTLGWLGGGPRLLPLYIYYMLLRRREENAAAICYAARVRRDGNLHDLEHAHFCSGGAPLIVARLHTAPQSSVER